MASAASNVVAREQGKQGGDRNLDTKILCLGVLVDGDASGYEIRKAFEEGALGHIQDAGFGSIYPALNKLNTDGLVTVRSFAQDGRPAKKVYSITDKGRLAFLDALMGPPAPDRLRSDFLFLMMHAPLLPPRQVEAMLDRRQGEYARKIEKMEECDGTGQRSVGHRFVHGFGLAIYRAAHDYIDAHCHEVVSESLGIGLADAAE